MKYYHHISGASIETPGAFFAFERSPLIVFYSTRAPHFLRSSLLSHPKKLTTKLAQDFTRNNPMYFFLFFLFGFCFCFSSTCIIFVLLFSLSPPVVVSQTRGHISGTPLLTRHVRWFVRAFVFYRDDEGSALFFASSTTRVVFCSERCYYCKAPFARPSIDRAVVRSLARPPIVRPFVGALDRR